MELHEIDYQLLKQMYENIDVLDVSEQNEIILLNNIPVEKKYALAVLCVTDSTATLNENEKAQLERILVYLKESFETVPVFICNKNNPVKFAQMASARNFSKLIVFGGNRKIQAVNVELEQVGHQPVRINNITLFFTYSLAAIESDAEKKKLLLAMLKQYFLPGA